tara:strand:+ start:2063 stop:3745 length:1683 start_codon:yes stop_codon:yes gene_type:complete
MEEKTNKKDPDKSSIDEILNKYKKFKFEEVIQDAKIILKEYPGHLRVMNLLAVSLLRTKKIQEAKKIFELIAENQPDDSQSHLNLGTFYLNTKDKEKSEQYLKKAIELNENNYMAYLNLGLLYYSKNDFESSINCYNKSLEIRPEQYLGYNHLGKAYFSIGDYKNSIINFEKAIDVKPDFAEAYENLGEIFEKLYDYEKAIDKLERAIIFRTKSHILYNKLAGLYIETENFDKAEKNYVKSIEIKSDYIPSLIGIINLHIKKKNTKNYELYFNKVKKLLKQSSLDDIERENYYNLLGTVLHENKYTNEAIDIFLKMKEPNHNSLLEAYLISDNKEKYEDYHNANLKNFDLVDINYSIITNFASSHFGIKKTNNLCNQPLEFIYKKNISKNTLNKINPEDLLKIFNKANDKNGDNEKHLINDPINDSDELLFLDKIFKNEIKRYANIYNNKDSVFIMNDGPKEITIRSFLNFKNNDGWLSKIKNRWLSGLFIFNPETIENAEYNLILACKKNLYQDHQIKQYENLALKNMDIILFPPNLQYSLNFESKDKMINIINIEVIR